MKAVLFDFDGVLTTDKTGSDSISSYVSKKTNISKQTFSAAYRKYNRQLSYGQLTHRDVWDRICDELETNIPYDYLFDSFIRTPIDRDMVMLVERIKRCGLKTGMITDNKQDRIDAVMAYYNWYSLFDVVAVSSKTGSGKDSEKIFSEVCIAISENPDSCIFIDNSEKNLVIPSEMGFTTILYNDEKRDFGGLVDRLTCLGVF